MDMDCMDVDVDVNVNDSAVASHKSQSQVNITSGGNGNGNGNGNAPGSFAFASATAGNTGTVFSLTGEADAATQTPALVDVVTPFVFCKMQQSITNTSSNSTVNSATASSLPTASYGFPDGVELRLIDDRVGRGVFAKRKFAKGDIIFMDSPIVSCQFAWNRMYTYKACDYCLRALETAEENCRRLMQKPSINLPFPECCETRKEFHVECPDCENSYCSEECRVLAWEEFHSLLCPMTKVPKDSHPLKVLDHFWRLIHYPPETCNIMLLVKLLVRLHQDHPNQLLKSRLAQFCQGTTDENKDLAHKMLGEEYMDQINKLRLLVASVVNFDDIQEWLTPEGFIQLFVLIGRNGQGVGSSSFAAWVENLEKLDETKIGAQDKAELLAKVDEYYHRMDEVVGHFLDNEGSALYPFQSWVNHSCAPNTEVKFPKRNHEIGLVAKRDIEEGEEITITYLDLGDMERSRYSRNKYLKEHYLFTCGCEKCESQVGEENMTSEDEDDDDEDDEDLEDDEDAFEDADFDGEEDFDENSIPVPPTTQL